jgi:hypothetical protein
MNTAVAEINSTLTINRIPGCTVTSRSCQPTEGTDDSCPTTTSTSFRNPKRPAGGGCRPACLIHISSGIATRTMRRCARCRQQVAHRSPAAHHTCLTSTEDFCLHCQPGSQLHCQIRTVLTDNHMSHHRPFRACRRLPSIRDSRETRRISFPGNEPFTGTKPARNASE